MRLVLAGVAWLAAFALFAALIEWSARPPGPAPTPPAVTDLVRTLNQPPSSSPSRKRRAWTVTRATSARRAMVVDVEADMPEDAREIASEIVDRVRSKYDELLIYVRPTGNPADAVVRRIQWTPHDGFVEMNY